MTRPRISVYILTCNQKHYIRQCIESALEQAADVFLEILVGDDCSDDGTSGVISELATMHPYLIQHVRHPSRLGPMKNCQELLRRARGEFLAHLDGDDYWLPGKLKIQSDYMERHPACQAVYTNAFTVSESGHVMGLFNNIGNVSFDIRTLVRQGNFLNASSMLFRSTLKAAILEINEPFIDYRMHLRHARKGELAQLDIPLVGYRLNAAGAMTATAASNDEVRRLYWEALMDVPRSLITDRDFTVGLADFLRRIIFRAIRSGRLSLLREWIPQVIGQSPSNALVLSALVSASAGRSIRLGVFDRTHYDSSGHRFGVRHRHKFANRTAQ